MEDYKLNRRKFIGMTALAGAALASPAYIRRASASGGEVIFGPITILFHKVSKNSLKQKPVSKLISA